MTVQGKDNILPFSFLGTQTHPTSRPPSKLTDDQRTTSATKKLETIKNYSHPFIVRLTKNSKETLWNFDYIIVYVCSLVSWLPVHASMMLDYYYYSHYSCAWADYNFLNDTWCSIEIKFKVLRAAPNIKKPRNKGRQRITKEDRQVFFFFFGIVIRISMKFLPE